MTARMFSHRLAWLGTLKFRIVAGCMLGALASSLITAHSVLQDNEARTRRLLIEHHALATERSARQLGGSIRLLHTVLSSAASGLTPAIVADDAAAAQYLEARHALHQLFDAAFIARHDGEVPVRTEAGRASSTHLHIGDREYFRRAIETGLPVVSRPVMGKVSGAPIVVVAVPVRSESGQVMAVLGGSLRLDSPRFSALPRVLSEGDTTDMLIDGAGGVIAHSEASRMSARPEDEPGFGSMFRHWQDNGATIHGEGIAQVAEGRLVSMAGVPEADWMVVRIESAARALEPALAARRTGWRTAGAVALATALLAGILAWWSARPITALRRRAQRLIDADDESPWPAAGGEVGALAGVLRHVVGQVRTRELETREMLRKLEAVLDHADVGVAFSRSGRLELVSRSFCTMFGRPAAELVGQPTRILYGSDQVYEDLSARARPSFIATGGFDGETPCVRADGSSFWAHMRGRAIEPGNVAAGTIWIFEDVTEERQRRETLHYAARHDALTGLVNRAEFEHRLESARVGSSAEPFCALFIDLDRFKQVNDEAGHAAGDQLLRDVAHRFEQQVRTTDTVARLGGDEFAVLLAGCPPLHAAAIAEKLRIAVETCQLDWEGACFRVGASIGLVHVEGQFGSCADVLRAADAACYAAKRGGRNRVAQHEATRPGSLAPILP